MRFLTSDNKLELNAKGAITDSETLTPWFNHPNIAKSKHDIILATGPHLKVEQVIHGFTP